MDGRRATTHCLQRLPGRPTLVDYRRSINAGDWR
nr:hypothetical protein [Klebsiella pneumoniae]